MKVIDMLNPYAWVMTLRRALYRKGTLPRTKVSIPVISIGNITTGGSGKSPITKCITEYLQHTLHKKPAIVMRGYKRRTKGFLLVSDGRQILADVRASGDEAQSFARELGGVMVICDEDRGNGAKHAIQCGAEVILLDDGYQHMALHRDLDILLIDKYSDQNVMPFGKNREDSAASIDADIIIRMDEFENAVSHNVNTIVIRASLTASHISLHDSSKELPEYLHGKRVLALSSIANPERFHNLLATFGADVVPYVLEDHADYSDTLIVDIIERAKRDDCDKIITTTKDIVKSKQHFERVGYAQNVGVLHITYSFSDQEIWKRINSLFT